MNELVFYGSYHNNKWNQLIHTIFVPAILWSSFVLLCHTGELTSFSVRDHAAQLGLPSVVSDNLVGNAAMLVYIIYAVYYVYLDRVAGLFASAVIFGLLLHANFLYVSLGATAALKVAIGVNLFSWYMQIHPGHAVFEGRKPALIDSFWQALLTAPFFVWFEVRSFDCVRFILWLLCKSIINMFIYCSGFVSVGLCTCHSRRASATCRR
jgi:uncharacterized membrane protein YGL010W